MTKIATLDELLACLKTDDPRLPHIGDEIDWSALPTFSDRVPTDTTGVWSYDDTRVLVGDSPETWCLEDRED